MLSLSSLECTCRKFSKQPRENLGIENVVPQIECRAKIRYDNQCNAIIPGMH
jgi:tetrahydromethanopterin S-methyltransferase subunit A